MELNICQNLYDYMVEDLEIDGDVAEKVLRKMDREMGCEIKRMLKKMERCLNKYLEQEEKK